MWPHALAAALLFVLACVPFRQILVDAAFVPAGLDLLQHYSRESVIRRAFDAGALPLWNPFEFSGFPLQADLQTGIFYPPSALLRALPVAQFLTWTIVFHVWLFGAGAYALGRALAISAPVSWIAASALMLGGITMPRVYAGHLDVIRTVAWIPLALALAVRALDRRAIRPSVLLVLALSCQLLASFVQYFVYTCAGIALYAACSAVWPRDGERSWRHAATLAAQLGLTAALVVGCTAFQWLPTARLVMAAGRTAGMPYVDALEGSFGLAELRAFVTPLRTLADLPREGWETSAYVGLLLACLAPFGIVADRRRRTAVFLLLVAGLTLAVASGGPAYSLHYSLFPMFRIPGRALAFWAVAIGLLGALTLDRITRPLLRAVALTTAAVLVVIDVAAYARLFVEPRALRDRFLQALPFTPTPGGRVLSLCESHAHPLELSALGVPSVDGYNSYFLGDYARLALQARHEPAETFIKAFPRIGDETTLPDLAVVSQLNVTEIIACEPLTHDALRLIARDGVFSVYQNVTAAGRVVPGPEEDSCGPSRGDDRLEISGLIADRPDGRLRFLASTTSARTLLLSEPFYPERRAWIDGVETPVTRANTALSAICVPAGRHVVELRYVPTTLMAGASITGATALLWFGATMFTRRRRSG